MWTRSGGLAATSQKSAERRCEGVWVWLCRWAGQVVVAADPGQAAAVHAPAHCGRQADRARAMLHLLLFRFVALGPQCCPAMRSCAHMQTLALRECMLKHADYYRPMLEEEEEMLKEQEEQQQAQQAAEGAGAAAVAAAEEVQQAAAAVAASAKP